MAADLPPDVAQPSVGRVVHYVSHGSPVRADGTQAFPSECRAAIVTEAEVGDLLVGVAVLNPTGMFFNRGVDYDGGDPGRAYRGGSWHWPERV